MRRPATLALSISFAVAVAILIGGLIPSGFGEGPVRRDGPLLHGAAFAVLVLPLTAVWPRRWPAVVVGAVVFGAAIEGLQMFVDRNPEWSDIVANVAGTLIGAAAGVVVSRRIGRRS